MGEVCNTCGLPSELCVCEDIAKEQQRISVSVVKRKFGKKHTIVTGIDPKAIDLKDLAKSLKNELACGGSCKDDQIELLGDHRESVIRSLAKRGFSA